MPDAPLPVKPAKSRTRKLSIHPAPYPQYLVPHITELLQRHIGETSGHEELLDCCAGLGKSLPAIARSVGLVPVGIELEQGYFDEGATDPCVIQGNARYLPFEPKSKRAGVTSFVYPNGCLMEDHRILTRDLRWVRAGDVQVGDELLAFDEETGGSPVPSGRRSRRRWANSTVTHSAPRQRECLKITLADGTEIITTPEHPWLGSRYQYRVGAEWCASEDLMGTPGSGLGGGGSRSAPFFVYRQLDTWDALASRDAGWLAGMLDGEGSLSVGSKTRPQLRLTQVAGPVLQRVEELMSQFGYLPKTYWHSLLAGRRKVGDVLVGGGIPNLLRALGELRPMRLLEKWESIDPSTIAIQPQKVQVVSVEPAGVHTIQEISTTTRTYIGEGFLMHNCADDFQANDSSVRNTYPHRIRAFRGKDYAMHPDNMGAMSPRRSPKAFETFMGVQFDITAEMHRVLKVGAPFVVNTKDPAYYRYTERTWRQLLAVGFAIVEHVQVDAKGLLYGEHYEIREEFEHLTVAIRLPDGVIESEARVPWPRHSSAS